MNPFKFTNVSNKYKKCPQCGSSYKGNDLKIDMGDEVITISCKCGFYKQVDENNKEIVPK